MNPDHLRWLDLACESAMESGSSAGAVLVKQDNNQSDNQSEQISTGSDRRALLNDPVAVAEMDCIRRAGRRSDQRELTLYSTRLPDMLVAGTVVQFAIGAVVIGLTEQSSPAIELLRERLVPVSFVNHAGCLALDGAA